MNYNNNPQLKANHSIAMGCKLNKTENHQSTFISTGSRQTDQTYYADHTTINTITTFSSRIPTEYNLEFGANTMICPIEQPRLKFFYQPKENVWANSCSDAF